MNKRLEELFNLDTEIGAGSAPVPVTAEEEPAPVIDTGTLDAIEKIEAALPTVRGLESSDRELDEIADMAKEAFNNLFDLGMQTDPRFSAEIFSVGGAMLGHALTAKTAKMQKKLKMIDLQLKQAELERKLAAADAAKPPQETPLGTGQIMDRNELIKMIMNGAHKNAAKDK